MVNAHFKCRNISQFKWLIDVINYWKWKDKKRLSLKRDVDLIQIGTLFSHWIISGAVDLVFQFGLYG
jgi:hypothetical protein